METLVKTTTTTKRVQRGVALLDQECPGWRDQIRMGDLDMANTYNCVLGQVYGGYEQAVVALNHKIATRRQRERHGFTLPKKVIMATITTDYEAWKREWNLLTVAWKGAIA